MWLYGLYRPLNCDAYCRWGHLHCFFPSRVHCRMQLLYGMCRWCLCNSCPTRLHTCSMRERLGKVDAQEDTWIWSTLFRVHRATCGRSLSYWNNAPESLHQNNLGDILLHCQTIGYVHKKCPLSEEDTLQTIMPCIRAVWHWTIWVAKWRRSGSHHTRLRTSFVPKQKQNLSVINTLCHSLV